MEKFRLEEMTAQEVSDVLEKVDTVLVPLGTLEQHGPHLPIGTDVFIPVEIAERVAEKLKVVVVQITSKTRLQKDCIHKWSWRKHPSNRFHRPQTS